MVRTDILEPVERRTAGTDEAENSLLLVAEIDHRAVCRTRDGIENSKLERCHVLHLIHLRPLVARHRISGSIFLKKGIVCQQKNIVEIYQPVFVLIAAVCLYAVAIVIGDRRVRSADQIRREIVFGAEKTFLFIKEVAHGFLRRQTERSGEIFRLVFLVHHCRIGAYEPVCIQEAETETVHVAYEKPFGTVPEVAFDTRLHVARRTVGEGDAQHFLKSLPVPDSGVAYALCQDVCLAASWRCEHQS